MKGNITRVWKRTKSSIEQNKSVGSAVFTLFSIFIGGILTAIGVAIFEPTYVYPSIKIFIATYLAGGILFTIGVAVIATIIVFLTIIKENTPILFSRNIDYRIYNIFSGYSVTVIKN